MHILLPETDNCPSWISGRERMTVENISWSISTKECCRPRWGLNPRPPGLQSECASNWATEAGNNLHEVSSYFLWKYNKETFKMSSLQFCLAISPSPVVQSIVILTSWLVVKMLTVLLLRTISNLQVFLLKKMWVAFAFAKATHIFSAKILVYMPYLMIKILTIS